MTENILESAKQIFPIFRDFFELTGVLFITIGSLYAIASYVLNLFEKAPAIMSFNKFKVDLGRAIASGLELIVVADIINTTIDVDYRKLGMLLILVIIRTIINYFLNQDMQDIPKNVRTKL